MSDTGLIGKGVLVIAILMLLVNLLYPGQNPAWAAFQSTLEQGPPVFNGPSAILPAQTLVPFADAFPNNKSLPGIGPNNWTNHYVPATTIPGCVNGSLGSSNWWGCVAQRDSEKSYVTLNGPTNVAFRVNVTSPTGNSANIVSTIQMEVQCRQVTAGPPVNLNMIFFKGYWASPSFSLQQVDHSSYCQVSEWTNLTYTWDVSSAGDTVANFTGGTVYLALTGTSQMVQISFVDLIVVPTSRTLCTDVWCSIQAFFGGVLNFFVTLGLGIIFIFQLAIFILSLIVQFLFGIMASIIYFLTLPNTPPLIQGLLGAMILGLMGMIIFTIIKTVRGTETH